MIQCRFLFTYLSHHNYAVCLLFNRKEFQGSVSFTRLSLLIADGERIKGVLSVSESLLTITYGHRCWQPLSCVPQLFGTGLTPASPVRERLVYTVPCCSRLILGSAPSVISFNSTRVSLGHAQAVSSYVAFEFEVEGLNWKSIP